MTTLIELVERLYPFTYSVVGPGNDAAIPAFLAELPFRICEYPSGADCNGWIVPPAVIPIKATLMRGRALVYDGLGSPLGVPALCPSVRMDLTLDELAPHLFSSEENPDAIPYHWTNLYRPGEKIWGFCLPKTLRDSLAPGRYSIEIETETKPGTMKVFDYILPGESSKTILLNAHNCHPFQANDDISGCAIGIAVMQRLRTISKRRFSYRLVIAPELIGTAHWLEGLGREAESLSATIMLKSLGNAAPLKLQNSFSGSAAIDRAAHHAMRHRFSDYLSGPFRTVYGNDETVFEAPGYEIPSISLTRFPFSSYHTDADRPETLSTAALQESLDVVLDIVEAMESDLVFKGTAHGLVSLSNPRYDLYRAAPAPGIDCESYPEINARWNLLMNCLPRLLDGRTGLLEIADRHRLPVREVREYVERWAEKGLAVCIELP